MGIWIKIWQMILGVSLPSEFCLRLSSVLMGTGCVYLAYLIGKKLFNEKVGLLDYLEKHYDCRQAFELKNYSRANVIRIYYCPFHKGK